MTLLVLDAAVVVDLICGFAPAERHRSRLAAASALAAPAHLDAEVLSALGRLKRAGQLTAEREHLQALGRLPAQRWPLRPLLEAAWLLTDRIAVKDALYVALAASLNATLVTTDGRLARSASAMVDVA